MRGRPRIRCMNPHCKQKGKLSRGLCAKCYPEFWRAVSSGKISDGSAVARKLVLPAKNGHKTWMEWAGVK